MGKALFRKHLAVYLSYGRFLSLLCWAKCPSRTHGIASFFFINEDIIFL